MPYVKYVYLDSGPSVIVNGVCSSKYVDDYVTRYCERGEEGPHSIHAVGTREHSLTWWEGDANAYNDSRVREK